MFVCVCVLLKWWSDVNYVVLVCVVCCSGVCCVLFCCVLSWCVLFVYVLCVVWCSGVCCAGVLCVILLCVVRRSVVCFVLSWCVLFVVHVCVVFSLTAQQAVQRAEPLSERLDMFGGAEPAGDRITEETIVFAHRLREEERTSVIMETTQLRFTWFMLSGRGADLLHELLVSHHAELLRCRLGHRHHEYVDARLSGQHGCLLQVVRWPAIDQHHHHPGVTPPPPVLLGEEGLYCVHDGFPCRRPTTRGDTNKPVRDVLMSF